MLICDGYKPKDCGRLNAERTEEDEVWLQDTSAYLLVRSSDASTLVEAMTFIAVPDSDQQVVLENVQKHKCEVIVVSKEDRTSKFEQWRIAAATCTVPASSSSRDDATVQDAQVLSKEQRAEAPQKQKASQDARSPGHLLLQMVTNLRLRVSASSRARRRLPLLLLATCRALTLMLRHRTAAALQ